MSDKKKNKVVCFSYIKPINKRFILKTAKDSGNTISQIVDAMIEAIRRGKEFDLSDKPKYMYAQKSELRKKAMQAKHDLLR